MLLAEYLRQQAATCQRLSQATFDLTTAERLRFLAAELTGQGRTRSRMTDEDFLPHLMQGNGFAGSNGAEQPGLTSTRLRRNSDKSANAREERVRTNYPDMTHNSDAPYPRADRTLHRLGPLARRHDLRAGARSRRARAGFLCGARPRSAASPIASLSTPPMRWRRIWRGAASSRASASRCGCRAGSRAWWRCSPARATARSAAPRCIATTPSARWSS